MRPGSPGTVKVAACPAFACWSVGWPVMPGGVPGALTVSVAVLPCADAGTVTDRDWLTVWWTSMLVEVADCDAVVATATGRGGSVTMPPEDVPGVGRLAWLTGPDGAAFSVITSAAP